MSGTTGRVIGIGGQMGLVIADIESWRRAALRNHQIDDRESHQLVALVTGHLPTLRSAAMTMQVMGTALASERGVCGPAAVRVMESAIGGRFVPDNEAA